MKKKGIVIGIIGGVIGCVVSITVAVAVAKERKRVWGEIHNADRFRETEWLDITEEMAKLRRDIEAYIKGGEKTDDADNNNA